MSLWFLYHKINFYLIQRDRQTKSLHACSFTFVQKMRRHSFLLVSFKYNYSSGFSDFNLNLFNLPYMSIFQLGWTRNKCMNERTFVCLTAWMTASSFSSAVSASVLILYGKNVYLCVCMCLDVFVYVSIWMSLLLLLLFFTYLVRKQFYFIIQQKFCCWHYTNAYLNKNNI